MSQRIGERQSNKSEGRRAIKSTLEDKESDFLKIFEKRMFSAARYWLRNERSEEAKMVNKSLHKILRLVDGIDKEIKGLESSNPVISLNYKILFKELKPFRAYIDKAKIFEKPKQRGASSINGDLALLIYAALERSKGNRSLVDAIGRILQIKGSLHTKIDKEYGIGAYTSLRIPIVNIEDRWERAAKKGLAKSARKFVSEVLNEHGEERFSRRVRSGGLSEIEFRIILEQQQADDLD